MRTGGPATARAIPNNAQSGVLSERRAGRWRAGSADGAEKDDSDAIHVSLHVGERAVDVRVGAVVGEVKKVSDEFQPAFELVSRLLGELWLRLTQPIPPVPSWMAAICNLLYGRRRGVVA
jgi:hypothetical protein